MKKTLFVPFLEDSSSFQEIDSSLLLVPAHKIDQVSWSAYPYLPNVSFKIAYNQENIILEYEVKEKYLKAVYLKKNDPVYKDSCVEFFISFDKKHYYNFEFNSLGTGLVGYGTKDRDSRLRLPAELIEKIITRSVVNTSKTEGTDNEWTLQLQIPFALFYKENIRSLKGVQATANFYKCGDDLPEPHFVSWNKIEASKPNFHLPEYFSAIEFMDSPL